MAALSFMFTFALITSLSVSFTMSRPLDLLRSKLKRVNIKYDDYRDKPFVRIKKEMIKDDKCAKGTIYYLKQCRNLDEYKQLKGEEDYKENFFTTETVTYATSKQDIEDVIVSNAKTTLRPILQKDKHLPNTESTQQFPDGTIIVSSHLDGDTGTHTLAPEKTANSRNTNKPQKTTAPSNHVNKSENSSRTRTESLVTVFVLSLAVLLIWFLRYLYYCLHRRSQIVSQRCLSDQQKPTDKLLSTKDTNNNTSSSCLEMSSLV